MFKLRLAALMILLAAAAVGFFVYQTEQDHSRFSFKLGLDLAGGTQLIYRADTSQVASGEEDEAMAALRDVIERRVNLFGVSEPSVAVERASALAAGEREERLIVELPGVTDIDQAVELIGETPLLEFKLARDASTLPQTSTSTPIDINDLFVDTGLTGRYLTRAQLQFDNSQQFGLREPYIAIKFNDQGAELFSEITGQNTGQILAIFLDGVPISTPVIQNRIDGGEAVITGSFSAEEAKDLARDLNFGALPVPIELVSTQSVGASLGRAAMESGIKAGLIGFSAVILFMLLWYRARGIAAGVSLAIYALIMLALFKLIPVTLTASGVTGFILSLGMAVDANILIFERISEELKAGKNKAEAVRQGFARAWNSIRDANISSIITAVILFWVGTSLVKGFALTFGIGVLASMLTAIAVSRTLLLAFSVSDK